VATLRVVHKLTIFVRRYADVTLSLLVADLEGDEPAPPPPHLGDGLTPSIWSFYCKTWYSVYS